MYLSVFFFIVNAILINPSECYHHYRSKLHRRQMSQIPQQIPQPYNSLKQPNSQFPVAYPVYSPSFAMNRLPDRNFGLSYGNPFEPPEPYFGNEAMRNGNVPVPNNNVRSLPANNEIPSHNVTASPANISISLVKNTELLIQSSPLKNAEIKTKADNVSPFPKFGIFPEFSSTFMGDTQPAFSNYGVPIENYRKSVLSAPSYLKPSGIDGSRRRITGSKRRKKNIGEYDDSLMKVFERGKKLLKFSTASNLTTENGVITDVTTDNYSSETDTIDYSTTLVPLPKGIQVKSVQKSADSLVHATVNISSSTQKIVTYDNNTEVENVIEMDMERKIEDGKGADKGYEEIQIIEKERVKPIVITKISKARRGKRKNQKNNFFDKRNKLLELSTLSDLTTVTDLTTDNDFTVDYYVTADNDLTSNKYDSTIDNHSDQTDEIAETEKVKPLYTSETSKFYRRKKNHKNNFGGKQKKQLEVPTENDLTTDNDVTTNNDFTADDDFATDNDFTTDNYGTIDDHSDETGATTETEKVRPILKLERSELPNKRMESKNNNFYEKDALFELSTRSDFAKIADITTDNDVNTDSEFITVKDLITDDNLTPHNYSDETKPIVETESVKPMFTLKTSKFHNTRKKRKNNNIFEKQKKLVELSTLNDLATTDNNTTGSYLKIDNDVITDNDFITENDLIIDNDDTIDNNFAGTGVIRETKKIEPMFKSETSKFHSRRSQMEKNNFLRGKKKLLERSMKSDLDTVIDNTIDNNFITDNDVIFDHDLSADNDFITDNDVISDNYSEEPGAIVETESSKPMLESKLSEFKRKRRKKYKNNFFQKEKEQLKISTVNYLTNNDVISDNYSEEPGAIVEKESAKPMAESKLSKLHRRNKNYKNKFFHKEKKRLKISTVNYPTNNDVTSDNYFEEPGAIVKMESAKPMAESKVSKFHGRRNKSYKNNFFQKEKKQIKISTVNYPIINDAQTNDNSVETDTTNYSTSLLHLPEGIQLKAVTKYDNSIIHAAVNISSSTQKIVTYDNNTELDNFIKMNMVERIEEEKGANKGYENVQIVEKKKVKPVVMSKIDRRRRKYHKNRFFTHHRSKRSILSSDEVPRSKSLYNKMAKRFLLALKRKERVVEPDDIMNRGVIPDFQEMNQKTSTGNKKQKIDHLIYDKKEMSNLIKLLLNEMKKFQISRENKKNINTPHRRTCNGCTGFKILPHKMKKLKITSPDPKPMNFIMNIWDSKMKARVAKSIEVLKEYKTVKYENTSTESTSELNSMTPKYVEEKQSAEMLTAVLFFSVMTCFVAVLSLVLSKSCKRLKVNRMKSAMKNYPLYDAYPKNRAKEIESKNLLPQENQELEWQSENGNWLSEI